MPYIWNVEEDAKPAMPGLPDGTRGIHLAYTYALPRIIGLGRL